MLNLQNIKDLEKTTLFSGTLNKLYLIEYKLVKLLFNVLLFIEC